MTIICATDFSPSSETATRLGVAMARRRGDTLLLLHVLEPLPVDPVGAGIRLVDWDDEMFTTAQAQLENQAERAPQEWSDGRKPGGARVCGGGRSRCGTRDEGFFDRRRIARAKGRGSTDSRKLCGEDRAARRPVRSWWQETTAPTSRGGSPPCLFGWRWRPTDRARAARCSSGFGPPPRRPRATSR